MEKIIDELSKTGYFGDELGQSKNDYGSLVIFVPPFGRKLDGKIYFHKQSGIPSELDFFY